mgnify:CR=1 FL=1
MLSLLLSLYLIISLSPSSPSLYSPVSLSSHHFLSPFLSHSLLSSLPLYLHLTLSLSSMWIVNKDAAAFTIDNRELPLDKCKKATTLYENAHHRHRNMQVEVTSAVNFFTNKIYFFSQPSSKLITVEVEMFALKNVCNFSNLANTKFFANKNYLRFFILFESL